MKRTFRDIPKSGASRDDFSHYWTAGLGREGLDWSELLKSRRVLMISEAGVGKTYECQQQASSLFDQGEAAFFLPLERVAQTGIASTLYGDLAKRFQLWLTSSSQMAYFFLDSIDELQLVHGSFREALSRLASDLEGALGRSTIVVTSRPVAIDRQAFRELLPLPKPPRRVSGEFNGEEFVRIAIDGAREEKPDPTPTIREIELLPLTDEQILEFARGRGVASPEALLVAIAAKHAHDFARRPQDLIELCDDWRDHGEIRSHFEQIKSHVIARLAARPDRREKADLPIEKARQGAQRLALATILVRRLTIRYSVGSDNEETGSAPIDPRALLQGWTVNEISALLERPVFAEGGYGRVRFHHRSVMEFLAAWQIHELIEGGTLSISAANRLIFGLTDTNKKLLKPSMRSVAGWLSLLRQDVFEAVLLAEPGTLLAYGDPESLTDSQRERALLGFVERYGKGQWRGLEIPNIQIARLAQAALSDTIWTAWRTGVESPEIRELLIGLISAGRFHACADLVASIADDTQASDLERFESLVALSKLTDPRLDAFVESAVSLSPGWTERIARWVGIHLYPEYVSDSQLLQLLDKIPGGRKRDGDYADDIARTIDKANLDVPRLETMLTGVMLRARGALEVKDDELVEKRGRLRFPRILAALCTRLLEAGSRSTELLQGSVLALRTSGDGTRSDKRNSKLRTLLNALPSAGRQTIFQLDLACIAQVTTGSGPRHQLVRLVHEGALSYEFGLDWHWVVGRLSDQKGANSDRVVLLDLALYLAPIGDDGRQELGTIQGAVQDSSDLLSQLKAATEPTKPSDQALRMQEKHRRLDEQHKERLAIEKGEWLSFGRELASQPTLALAPDRLERSLWNLGLFLRKNEHGRDEGRWDRAFLETQFGHEVTNALRLGFMSYWRSMKPTLRGEREASEKNTYLVVWSVGLIGIYAEAEDPAWATKLSSEDAELAARYALLELNGLPSWLASLAEGHSAAVEKILGEAVDAELGEPLEKEQWHSMLLQSLRSGPPQLVFLLQRRLAAWLEGPGLALMQMPHSDFAERKLDQVASVLLAQGDQSALNKLENLSAEQILSVGSGKFLFFWMPVLFRLNPARGAATLLDLVDKLPVEKDGAAVRAIGSLFNERRTERSADWGVAIPADMLLKLTIAVHRHVKVEDDLVHENVYSPSFRDYAENGRRYIFEVFMRLSGENAMRSKLELAAHPIFENLKDRIAALAQERLATEVDANVAEVSELAGLFEGRDLPPKTGGAMAQLLVDRLDDLQELMLRDTGPRAAWAMVNDENNLRPAITRELENSARGAYTVDQEAVTVDGKETDIRLRSVSGHQATIELKVGEKSRSGRVLRDTVEQQLVTKYMAHRMARVGCLLVTVSDPEKRWRHPDTNSLIDRFQLQELLDAAAQAAQLRLGGEARVLARVLDLTPRLKTEASSAAKNGTR